MSPKTTPRAPTTRAARPTPGRVATDRQYAGITCSSHRTTAGCRQPHGSPLPVTSADDADHRTRDESEAAKHHADESETTKGAGPATHLEAERHRSRAHDDRQSGPE